MPLGPGMRLSTRPFSARPKARAADETESNDLAGLEPAHTERLLAQLGEIDRTHPPLFDEAVRADLSPETTEALRALGYLD